MMGLLRMLAGTVISLGGAILIFLADKLPLFPASIFLGTVVIVAGYKLATFELGEISPAEVARDFALSLGMLILVLGGGTLFVAGENSNRGWAVATGLVSILGGAWLMRMKRRWFLHRGRKPLMLKTLVPVIVLMISACASVPPQPGATLPLLRPEDQARETVLLSLEPDRRLDYLAAQGIKPRPKLLPVGKTVREVWSYGREVVTYYRPKDNAAFLRPTDDTPRSESAPPAYRWEMRGDVIVNTGTGEATLYVGDELIGLWAMAPDGSNLRRFEQVGQGDYTWARAIPRTVAASPDVALPDPPNLPSAAEHLQLDRSLLGAKQPGPILGRNGYRRMEPEDVLGRTIEIVGTSVRVRRFYGAEGVSRSRGSWEPKGVVSLAPLRKFGGELVRDEGKEDHFWSKDGRSGFVVTHHLLSGEPPTTARFIIVGEGNFVDGWGMGR